jgi:hypothetical protein
LRRFAQVLLKPGHTKWVVSFPYGVAREPSYNILSKRFAYYLRYATGKKGIMLIFLMLQLSHIQTWGR